ncbi:MAG: histidinol-phosphate aminotransferase family protein [Acidimicrobiia bacterium]|nr:histidinol-phosphate aminotransferase family protein [Acidimicrobiia bacterium]
MARSCTRLGNTGNPALGDRMRVVHGGLDEAELYHFGLDREQVLDFSSSINPLGTADSVRNAALSADLAAYPDRQSWRLRVALATSEGIRPNEVVVGNGSAELIHLIAQNYLNATSRCLILAPTFGEYEAAAAQTGAEVVHLRARQEDGFRWPIPSTVTRIEQARPDLVFLCNPNNPTGVYLDRITVTRLAEAAGSSGLLVLDDAFVPFVTTPWDTRSLIDSGKVILVRSLTKSHALAGVRLGYAIARENIIERIESLQYTWSVNAIAQAAGLAALREDKHVERAREVVGEAMAYLRDELLRIGLFPEPPDANFLIVDVGDGARVREALLHHAIAVRACTSFGLPGYIRIAARPLVECKYLIAALEKIMAEGVITGVNL